MSHTFIREMVQHSQDRALAGSQAPALSPPLHSGPGVQTAEMKQASSRKRQVCRVSLLPQRLGATPHTRALSLSGNFRAKPELIQWVCLGHFQGRSDRLVYRAFP